MKQKLREVYATLADAKKIHSFCTTDSSIDHGVLWSAAKVSEDLSTDFLDYVRAKLRVYNMQRGEAIVTGSFVVVPYDIMTDILYTLEELSREDRSGHRNEQPSFSDLARSYEES